MRYFKAFRICDGKLVSVNPAYSFCGSKRIAGSLTYYLGKRTDKIPGSLGIFIWESEGEYQDPMALFGDAIYEVKVGPVKPINLVLSLVVRDVPESIYQTILNNEYPEPEYRWMVLELERGLVTEWIVPIHLVWLKPGKEIPNESL